VDRFRLRHVSPKQHKAAEQWLPERQTPNCSSVITPTKAVWDMTESISRELRSCRPVTEEMRKKTQKERKYT